MFYNMYNILLNVSIYGNNNNDAIAVDAGVRQRLLYRKLNSSSTLYNNIIYRIICLSAVQIFTDVYGSLFS